MTLLRCGAGDRELSRVPPVRHVAPPDDRNAGRTCEVLASICGYSSQHALRAASPPIGLVAARKPPNTSRPTRSSSTAPRTEKEAEGHAVHVARSLSLRDVPLILRGVSGEDHDVPVAQPCVIVENCELTLSRWAGPVWIEEELAVGPVVDDAVFGIGGERAAVEGVRERCPVPSVVKIAWASLMVSCLCSKSVMWSRLGIRTPPKSGKKRRGE